MVLVRHATCTDAALPRRRSPCHTADKLTAPTEQFLMQSVSQPVIGNTQQHVEEVHRTTSRPESHQIRHRTRTDGYTRRAALAQDTSEKSRSHVRDHDAKMHLAGNSRGQGLEL